jgi:hypothetical protein
MKNSRGLIAMVLSSALVAGALGFTFYETKHKLNLPKTEIALSTTPSPSASGAANSGEDNTNTPEYWAKVRSEMPKNGEDDFFNYLTPKETETVQKRTSIDEEVSNQAGPKIPNEKPKIESTQQPVQIPNGLSSEQYNNLKELEKTWGGKILGLEPEKPADLKKAGLEKYFFKKEELKKEIDLNPSVLIYGERTNPAIRYKDELNEEDRQFLEKFNIESIAMGEYVIWDEGTSRKTENLSIKVLKFKNKKDLNNLLKIKGEEIYHSPIFVEDRVISIISPGIDDVYSEESFGAEQEITYEQFLKDYSKKTGINIQLVGESKEGTADLLKKIRDKNKENQRILDLMKSAYN